MLRRLLLAAPSVPSATLTPAWCSLWTGQIPEASFMLDRGQCTTWLLLSTSRWMSSLESDVM